MGDLRRYREKRRPEGTPEPFGAEFSPRVLDPGAARAFVVQQHAARRMHWDLRLEIGEVLVSWAVPRGPSLDPAEKRLAVQTEDHPFEYADFEGVIPTGNYGAGAMIVWDRGIYRTLSGASPAQGLADGKLDLLLEGHKLRGRFALVRTRGEGGRDWLLLRKGEAPAEPGELIDAEPGSVLSGLTVAELRDGANREAELGALLADLETTPVRGDPRSLRPMLASTAEEPFSRPGWLFELKYDGVRILAVKDGADVFLVSRRGRDCTRLYGEVALAVRHLPVERCVLDGEVVALDSAGRSSFELLQRRFTQTTPEGMARARAEIPVVFYAFDLLQAQGRDLRRCPLTSRKDALASFTPRLGQVRFADHVEGDGMALYEAAESHGLEGIVAKRADSRYEAERRARTWQKLKIPRSAYLAIVGVRGGKGSRARLGSLMLAWQRDGEWRYAGSVGSGLDDATIDALLERLPAARVAEATCSGAPDPSGDGFHVAPEIVCEVRFTEVTQAGNLRHPVFRGLRDDVALEHCRAPADRSDAAADVAPPAAEPGLQLTRLDKVFWPVEGYTKGDLLRYYEAAWPFLAPYLHDRPVVLTRYPDGIDGKNFYQKNAPDFTPEWATRREIEGTDYFVCNDLRTLLYVVNSGAIPLHVWHSRLADLEHPDWLILDLDPKEAPFEHVVRVARHVHKLLRGLDAPHYVKTSGQDGLHVLLPLAGQLDHAEAKAFGEVLARVVCADLPEIATITRPVAARGGKVYVDYLQNGRGKLIASAYSVRPRAGAPISMPLRWAQVTRRLDPARWNIRTGLAELERRGDPNRAVFETRVDVAALLGELGDQLARASEA